MREYVGLHFIQPNLRVLVAQPDHPSGSAGDSVADWRTGYVCIMADRAGGAGTRIPSVLLFSHPGEDNVVDYFVGEMVAGRAYASHYALPETRRNTALETMRNLAWGRQI